MVLCIKEFITECRETLSTSEDNIRVVPFNNCV